ncbi:MAG: hypothetical protein ACAI35_26140 [Candidatus Methylacidiphilales bacterium]
MAPPKTSTKAKKPSPIVPVATSKASVAAKVKIAEKPVASPAAPAKSAPLPTTKAKTEAPAMPVVKANSAKATTKKKAGPGLGSVSVTVTPLDPAELTETVLTPIALVKTEPVKTLRKQTPGKKPAATPIAVTPLDLQSSLAPVTLAPPIVSESTAPSPLSTGSTRLPKFKGSNKIAHLPELHFPLAVRVVKAHFDSMLSANLPEATLVLACAPISNIQLRLYFVFSGVKDVIFASMAPEGLLVKGFTIDEAGHLGQTGMEWHISDASSQRALSFFARDVELASFVMEG